jgi:hypothetical protein
MQCAATAATAVGSAAGIRAWLRGRGRVGPGTMRALTAGLVVVAVVVAGLA